MKCTDPSVCAICGNDMRFWYTCYECDTSDVEIIKDLRDRLKLFKNFICLDCGCDTISGKEAIYRCEDCSNVYFDNMYGFKSPECSVSIGSHISVGLRALCGRKLL